MKQTKEQDIYDAVAEFRAEHSEKVDAAHESVTQIVAILLKHNSSERTRILSMAAIALSFTHVP